MTLYVSHFLQEQEEEEEMFRHLDVVWQGVDELEAGDSLVAADHAHILAVLAVGHSDAVGRTQGQGLLLAGAVQVVEPDGS